MKLSIKIVYQLLIFALTTPVLAQTAYNENLLLQSDGKVIHISGSYQTMSSALSNGFTNTLYFGGHIDTEAKLREQDRMKKQNSIGGFAHSELNAMGLWGNDSSRIKLGITTGNYSYLGWNYTDDFFNLVFFGNKDYVGEVADMSATGFNVQQFSKLGINFQLPQERLFFSVSMVVGQKMARGYFSDLSLYTHPDAAQLDFTMRGQTTFSDTSQNRIKGLGASFDMYFQAYKDDRNGFINLYFQNIGFVNWNNTVQYHLDTIYSYSGFELNNLFNNNNLSTDMGSLQDSLIPNAIHKNQLLMLPGCFGVSGRFAPTKNTTWLVKYAANGILTSGYRLFTTLGVVYVKEKWDVSVVAHHGGFGGFSTEASFNYRGEEFHAGLSIFQAAGFFSDNSQGKGVSVYFCKTFR